MSRPFGNRCESNEALVRAGRHQSLSSTAGIIVGGGIGVEHARRGRREAGECSVRGNPQSGGTGNATGSSGEKSSISKSVRPDFDTPEHVKASAIDALNRVRFIIRSTTDSGVAGSFGGAVAGGQEFDVRSADGNPGDGWRTGSFVPDLYEHPQSR